MKILLVSVIWIADKIIRIGVAISILGALITVICSSRLEK